jgi:hypothetical protein
MRKAIFPSAFAIAASFAAPAFAQDAASPVEFELSGRIVIGVGAFSESGGGADPQGVVVRYEGEGSVERIFDNGLTIGASGEVAVELDRPERTPRGGRAGSCPAGFADCASVAGRPVRAPISGFSGGGVTGNDAPRTVIEEAYLYAEGGWGEMSLGLTEGAATELSLSTPTVLGGTSNVDGSLNFTGLGGAQTINDFSGSSAKITAESVAILGLRGAISYTPEANYETLDQGFSPRGGGPVDYIGENVLEAGLAFNRVWSNGLQTEASVTYLTAESANNAPEFDRLNTWNASVQLELGAFRVGAAYLNSDNGWAQGDRGYESLAASGVYETGPWSVMLEGSDSSDNLAHTDIWTILAAVRHDMGQGVGLSFGASHQDRSVPLVTTAGRGSTDQRSTGVFLEIAADL